jgi:hypothetical protein
MPASTVIKQGTGPDAGAKSETDNLVEARIVALHAKLTITPAQERLWSHVAQVMRDNEKAMDALHNKGRSNHATSKTAVEEVKFYAEIAGVHAEGLQKFVPVFEALYASMSDRQRKNADTLFSNDNPVAKKSTKSKKQ